MKKIRYIFEIKQIAIQRNGKCLSDHFDTISDKALWMCNKGHQWEARISSVINDGSWCPECHLDTKRDKIETFHEIAKDHGGKCLSQTYLNGFQKLDFECEYGHKFSIAPMHIKKGVWCPYCGKHIKEEFCRFLFETLFNDKFPKIKPKWLINDDGNRMELDGYNEELKIAFEYNGEQHYTESLFFMDDKKLLKRQNDDKKKKELCEKHNIFLIVIKYADSLKNLQKKVIEKYKQISGKEIDINTKIDFSKFVHISKRKLDEANAVAQKNNGKCLSNLYFGSTHKLKFECYKGHQWETLLNVVKKGHWCPFCNEVVKDTINSMHILAQKNGGLCLSKSYINARTKLLWQCNKKHQFEMTPDHVKHNHWCPICRHKSQRQPNKYTIQEMVKIAKERNGECLSINYVDANTKLKWKCNVCNTIWYTTPSTILNSKRWCPKCGINKAKEYAKSKRHGIEKCNEIAKQYGGMCLSTNYIDAFSQLRWRCKNGHEWIASLNTVKNKKRWCKICAKILKKQKSIMILDHFVI